ncbi:MbcA/ParS/Xre antitoxin family protein [Deinococcus budaensis]|uniref:Antitoxin Xre/MbcA/ParS-like toxin-binding domain-containing protein n=1 Tax=Deinococcus budaensis TaxID=1665626 RepID=A0A7W8LRE1_9DEIO|nr:MbcA/ParS/Xre antitoxin family protein [Deinococcus budaensis]MBB5235537.1 hypothetical protein [Deinococcus budaensis]
MTVAPHVQGEGLYQQIVRGLIGLEAEAAERLVVEGEGLPLLTVAAARQHLKPFLGVGQPPAFLRGWRGTVSVRMLDDLLAFCRLYADVRLVLSEEDAARWLSRPNRHLEGWSPLDLLASRVGERRVRAYLEGLLSGNYG